MKLFRLTLGKKVFVAYLLISSGIAWYLSEKAPEKLGKSIDETAEEVMIDAANLISQFVTLNTKDNQIDVGTLHTVVSKYLRRDIGAKIYTNEIQKPSLEIYVTNKDGIVIYDSSLRYVGKDFSQDNDVYLTLRGDYGARSSAYDRENKDPSPEEKAFYVAAPIYNKHISISNNNKEIIGVITVVKKTSQLSPFIDAQKKLIRKGAFIIFVISIMFGIGISFVISRSTNKLIKYTTSLTKGEYTPPLEIRQVEFAELANAIEELRVDLEGREYVEEYVNTMAHELKTPIAGIQATAENLLTPMDDKQRQHHINNILEANNRMNLLITRLLDLSKIERLDVVDNLELIDVKTLIADVIKTPARLKRITDKSIALEYDIDRDFSLNVEKLLAEQAIGNVIDNAIDFTPNDSTITIQARELNKSINIKVMDQGEGIPEFARKQLFKRFFTTSRPDTGKRGNGLGLRFVREIMNLHGGDAQVKNRFMEKGAVATLSFPIQKG